MRERILSSLLLFFSPCFLHFVEADNGQDENVTNPRNVKRQGLEKCSGRDMAVTGANQTGFCTGEGLASDDDSELICIDLTTTFSVHGDFCEVSGVAVDDNLWCNNTDMPCVQDTTLLCPVQAWCVSARSFSSYVKTEGCMAIGNIECESVNFQALEIYEIDRTVYSDALNCLVDRCGLFLIYSSDRSSLADGGVGSHDPVNMIGYAAVLLGVVMATCIFIRRTVRDPDVPEDEPPQAESNELPLPT